MKNDEECIHCCLTFAILNKEFEKVKDILESGIDLNEQSDCNDALYYAVKENNPELLELLIERGADPNLKLDHKRLPIVQAIEDRNINMVKLLISLGATFNDFPIADFIGRSDNPELIEFILSTGLDVGFKDEITGRNSLHIAAMCGYENICLLLLKSKINFNLKDKWGNTPADLARVNNYYNIVSIIQEFTAGNTLKHIS